MSTSTSVSSGSTTGGTSVKSSLSNVGFSSVGSSCVSPVSAPTVLSCSASTKSFIN